MTPIAFIHLNTFATPIALAGRGNPLGNHFKMHHVMAGWRLMTLSAICRTWGRMLEFRNGPLRSGMARNTTLTEEPVVPVFGAMARRTVKGRLKQRHSRVAAAGKRSSMSPYPRVKLSVQLLLLSIGSRLGRESESNLRQLIMVHSNKPFVRALMFEVALGAVSNVCVKRCGLTLKECLIIGMTTDTFAVHGAFKRCVARSAIPFHR